MEGPSLVILREELEPFVGKRISTASGNSKQIDIESLEGRVLKDVLSWGKHLLLQIGNTTLKIHFLMFGSYTINKPKPERVPRLQLQFKNGTVYFYSCSVKPFEGDPRKLYDWSVDTMSPKFSELRAIRAVREQPGAFVCDILMDQDVFAGVGNIIKNEVLHRLGLHPLARVSDLSAAQVRALVRETRKYCGQFFEWKKAFVLKKNWKVFRRRSCAKCGTKPQKVLTGKLNRVSWICPICQNLGQVSEELARKAA